MRPSHHAIEEDLFEYATGASPEWLSLVTACHLTFCDECRREVRLLEDVGGLLLAEHVATDVVVPPFEAIAERLTASGSVPREKERSAGGALPGVTLGAASDPRLERLPRAIHPYLTADRFRWFAPGVRHIPLAVSAGTLPMRLIEFKPGFDVPEHRHRANEYVLVLDGTLEDTASGEIFSTGDLSLRQEGDIHGQKIPRTEACVCLVGSTEQVIATSAWGRFLQRLTGV